MQIKNKFFDDLAKTATGLAGGASNIKGDIDIMIKNHLEKILATTDMVSREEFNIVKEMAKKAQTENEKLEKR